MPLRHATAEVFGPGRFLPIFAGPGPIQALVDGDLPGTAGPSKAPQPARVALQLTPGSAKYDGKAGTLTLGVAGEGPVVEAGVQDGGLVKAALAHTGPDVREAGKNAGRAVKLEAAALTIDVGVPQAPMALARAKAKAAAGGVAAAAAAPAAAPATGKVAAASVQAP
jgi:hypothetical protein